MNICLNFQIDISKHTSYTPLREKRTIRCYPISFQPPAANRQLYIRYRALRNHPSGYANVPGCWRRQTTDWKDCPPCYPLNYADWAESNPPLKINPHRHLTRITKNCSNASHMNPCRSTNLSIAVVLQPRKWHRCR
jgi:hypothetical protein